MKKIQKLALSIFLGMATCALPFSAGTTLFSNTKTLPHSELVAKLFYDKILPHKENLLWVNKDKFLALIVISALINEYINIKSLDQDKYLNKELIKNYVNPMDLLFKWMECIIDTDKKELSVKNVFTADDFHISFTKMLSKPESSDEISKFLNLKRTDIVTHKDFQFCFDFLEFLSQARQNFLNQLKDFDDMNEYLLKSLIAPASGSWDDLSKGNINLFYIEDNVKNESAINDFRTALKKNIVDFLHAFVSSITTLEADLKDFVKDKFNTTLSQDMNRATESAQNLVRKKGTETSKAKNESDNAKTNITQKQKIVSDYLLSLKYKTIELMKKLNK